MECTRKPIVLWVHRNTWTFHFSLMILFTSSYVRVTELRFIEQRSDSLAFGVSSLTLSHQCVRAFFFYSLYFGNFADAWPTCLSTTNFFFFGFWVLPFLLFAHETPDKRNKKPKISENRNCLKCVDNNRIRFCGLFN